MGLEPTTSGLEVRRAIHCATETEPIPSLTLTHFLLISCSLSLTFLPSHLHPPLLLHAALCQLFVHKDNYAASLTTITKAYKRWRVICLISLVLRLLLFSQEESIHIHLCLVISKLHQCLEEVIKCFLHCTSLQTERLHTEAKKSWFSSSKKQTCLIPCNLKSTSKSQVLTLKLLLCPYPDALVLHCFSLWKLCSLQ